MTIGKFVSVVLCVWLLLTNGVAAQITKKPLAVEEIELLLQQNVSTRRGATLVEEQGVKFEVTVAVRERLRKAGADEEVLAAVERAAFANARKKLEEEQGKVEEAKKRLEAKEQEDEKRRKDEEKKAAAEAKRKAEEETRRQADEKARREEEARKQAEEEARRKVQEETQRPGAERRGSLSVTEAGDALHTEEYAKLLSEESSEASAMFKTAFHALKEQQYDKAISQFRFFQRNYPQSELADDAQYWIGESYFTRRDYNRAILEYNDVLKYRKGDKVPAALLRQSQAFFEIGFKYDARLILQKLINDHPNSKQAKEARDRLSAF